MLAVGLTLSTPSAEVFLASPWLLWKSLRAGAARPLHYSFCREPRGWVTAGSPAASISGRTRGAGWEAGGSSCQPCTAGPTPCPDRSPRGQPTEPHTGTWPTETRHR